MFLQGLIQVTAAFHHLQRNNLLGTELLLRAALGRIERYPACFGGISVALLRNDIQEWLEALEAAAPAPPTGFARIACLTVEQQEPGRGGAEHSSGCGAS